MISHDVVLMGLVVGNVVAQAIGRFAIVYFAIRLALRHEGRVPR